jgi:hypothetical protein
MSKKIKILLSVLAGVALCVGIVYAVSNVPRAAIDEQPNSNNSTGPADRVDVVYFHRAQRCHSCLYAENMTLYTVETYFADELASGKLTYQSINVGDSQNGATVEEYGAYGSQLFINTVKDGTDHIEQVTDIWLVIGDDQSFVEIVKSDIEHSLTGEA